MRIGLDSCTCRYGAGLWGRPEQPLKAERYLQRAREFRSVGVQSLTLGMRGTWKPLAFQYFAGRRRRQRFAWSWAATPFTWR